MTDYDHEFTVGDPQSVVLGPTEDPDTDEWRLSFQTVTDDRVAITLHPRALDELHIEAKDVPSEARDTKRLPRSERVDVYHDHDDEAE